MGTVQAIKQLAVNKEVYVDTFLGDTGGNVLTSYMSSGFGFSPHKQTYIR